MAAGHLSFRGFISQFCSEPEQGRGGLFIGGLLETPAPGVLTGTMKALNKRVEIRGAKYTLERLLVRQATVTLAVCRGF